MSRDRPRGHGQSRRRADRSAAQTPDRPAVGAAVTQRVRRITGMVLLAATGVLAAVVVVGRLT